MKSTILNVPICFIFFISDAVGTAFSILPARKGEAQKAINFQTVIAETFTITTSETLQLTTYASFTTLKTSLTTFIVDPHGTTVPIVIGPGGVGWQVPSRTKGQPILTPPTVLPSQSPVSNPLKSSKATSKSKATFKGTLPSSPSKGTETTHSTTSSHRKSSPGTSTPKGSPAAPATKPQSSGAKPSGTLTASSKEIPGISTIPTAKTHISSTSKVISLTRGSKASTGNLESLSRSSTAKDIATTPSSKGPIDSHSKSASSRSLQPRPTDTTPGNPKTSQGGTDSTAPPVLSTITPRSVSTKSFSTINGVTDNTFITTTDGNGHSTIVPFFWHCWFCGGGGILGFGIGPGPGIYPPPIPPPVRDWPTITIGSNGQPTPGPSPSPSPGQSPRPSNSKTRPSSERPTSSAKSRSSTKTTSTTSSCTSSVVTNTFVSCASLARMGVKSASCSTSTKVVTGCSVTGTATTTAKACNIQASKDPNWPFGDNGEYPTIGAGDVEWTAAQSIMYTHMSNKPTGSESKTKTRKPSTASLSGPSKSQSAKTSKPALSSSGTQSRHISSASHVNVGSVSKASSKTTSKATSTAATKNPLCIPGQHNGNRLESSCKADTYCVCSDQKTYVAVSSGTNPCPYTALPTKLYTSDCPSSTKPPTEPPKTSQAPSDPSPTSQSSPPQPTRRVVIVFNNYIAAYGRGPVIPIQVWKAWDVLQTDGIDYCGNGHVYRGGDLGNPQHMVKKDDQFPINIGPFDISGHSKCAYQGQDHSTVGKLSCTGGFPFTIGCDAFAQSAQTPFDCSQTIFGGAGENGESARIECRY